MTNNPECTFSFWQLINTYNIEIPVIQRDYAQGRDDSKAKSVRKQIVENMTSALIEENGKLKFDFVYGRVSDGTLIPIDGQQRLTTLFLFHVYVFKACCKHNKGNCALEKCNTIADTLKKFTYATRQSSREFCAELIEKDIMPESDDGKIEAFVTDTSWFYPDWASDPTVAGMLRTLDEIHFHMKEEKASELLEKLLADDCPITFQFLDMHGHGLTDDLYLKMNARGLPLSPWENFKAQLEQWLDEQFKKISEEKRPEWFYAEKPEDLFSHKLDGVWLDAFWKMFSEGDPKKPEQQLLSVFRRHFYNLWALKYQTSEKSDSLLQTSVDSDTFVPFSEYKTVLDNTDITKTTETLDPIVNLFDFLAQNKDVPKEQFEMINTEPSWAKNVKPAEMQTDKIQWRLQEMKAPTYRTRVLFHAAIKCFSKPVENISDFGNQYNEWMRVVWNITENYDVFNFESYLSVLKLIDELGGRWNEILGWLTSPDLKIASDAAKPQIKEEVEKAKLFNNKPEWREQIEKAEGNHLFKGSLRFLMHGEDWKNHFEDRLKRALALFKEDSKDSRIVVFRSFVSRFEKWDLFWNGLTYDASSASWRRVLRFEDKNQMNAWTEPLYKVLDTKSNDTFNVWFEEKSMLKGDDNYGKKIAHEVLFQKEIIGNCWSESKMRWDPTRFTLGKDYSRENNRITLDKRQFELPKLDAKKTLPIWGIDSQFVSKEKHYVWDRDGKIYAFNIVTKLKIPEQEYRITEEGELVLNDL